MEKKWNLISKKSVKLIAVGNKNMHVQKKIFTKFILETILLNDKLSKFQTKKNIVLNLTSSIHTNPIWMSTYYCLEQEIDTRNGYKKSI